MGDRKTKMSALAAASQAFMPLTTSVGTAPPRFLSLRW